MKADKTVNFLMYLAGMAFNLALMALVAFLVLTAFNRGYATGSEFAEYMVPYTCEICGGERPFCERCEELHYAIEFVIPHDASIAEIAERLEAYGIIHNRHMFQLDLFLRGETRDFTAGTYTVNLTMTNIEVNRALRARAADVAPHEVITVLEGWTIRDMAEYFESRGFFEADYFMYIAQDGHFSFSFLLDVPTDRPNRLEGYLFPDTYQIPVNPTPAQIITRMLTNFQSQFTDEFHMRAEEMGLTIDEVVIMASIIESETRLASERPIVSQVIHRRLAQNWLLQMCSTVKYTMDDPPTVLLNVHLEVDTPWNTYMHPGLPVGPISNPGAAAISAALWPSDTDYMFFVLRDEATGAHTFTRTAAEHAAAADRYEVGTR